MYVFVVRWKDGRGETSRSTPAYSEPWMRRERINVSVHSIYAIVCRSPRQTKRLGLRCLSNFVNILCPFHLIILTQCYLLREAYVCALCVYLVHIRTLRTHCARACLIRRNAIYDDIPPYSKNDPRYPCFSIDLATLVHAVSLAVAQYECSLLHSVK